MDEASSIFNGVQVISQLRHNQITKQQSKEKTIRAYFNAYPGITKALPIRFGACLYGRDYQFKAEDICDIHELWLANIYPFAGKYRTVMMNKDGFSFAAPQYIDNSIKEFEIKFLKKFTPCTFTQETELALALGVVMWNSLLFTPFVKVMDE